jgi:hypothetical protein
MVCPWVVGHAVVALPAEQHVSSSVIIFRFNSLNGFPFPFTLPFLSAHLSHYAILRSPVVSQHNSLRKFRQYGGLAMRAWKPRMSEDEALESQCLARLIGLETFSMHNGHSPLLPISTNNTTCDV